MNATDRFEQKVIRGPGCWNWVGAINSAGYGSFMLSKGSVTNAHKAAYLLYIGPVVKGQVVMHTCDNRLCVNPSHLRLGSSDDNNKDMAAKHRAKTGGRPGPRLSPEEVKEIQFSTVGTNELATKYGVSRHTIWAIRTGRTWQNVG